ncbi:peptide-N4-(N-acetyl-beta- glucosaminyl)asparagine amidase [Haplosporangium sp. Z 767]|nr:peptide-N4-(N-acetyl-beta- glucosaminyl)asparagine amidase [Haplosporangium sp. Z 767]KAF9193071.1 peptide-N4-(N-acetyl-beta- glucosaminyl)asparagine amidase [Haplosporangium sp. Z 11]
MDPDKDAQKMQELAQELARQFTASMRLQQPPISGQHSGANQSANANVTSTSAETDAKIAEMAKQLGSLLNNTAAQPGPLQKTPIATAAKAQDDQDPFASVPEPSIFERDFTNTYAGVNASVLAYENRELLDLASDQMPIGRFFEEAEAMAKEYPDDSLDDIVIRRLLHWFKNEYFTWVNAPPCVNCQGGTVGIGGVAPTSQESQDGARVVETYRCTQTCSDITRFPRYGGMSKVLFKTRRGRCGEWANCFTVCCRALGYKTRYVHDTTDHVWTEVWSEHKKRWIHCDSCEAAYDQPLLYTTGWGKSLSYCVAFSGN